MKKREHFEAAKRAALNVLQRKALTLRIRVACGGLTFVDRLQIDSQAHMLLAMAQTICAYPFPSDAEQGVREVSPNYLHAPDTS
jgi:hypothetical protein